MRRLKSFDIWQNVGGGTLIRYRCFEDVVTGEFCVQSGDFYRNHSSPEELMRMDEQFISLLQEEDPFARSGAFATLEEAIEDHNRTFS